MWLAVAGLVSWGTCMFGGWCLTFLFSCISYGRVKHSNALLRDRKTWTLNLSAHGESYIRLTRMCMKNTCGSVRPPSVSNSTGASSSDAHVRWMYVADNIMWSLELGSQKDE